jgi:hypothetical protein
MSMFPTAVEVLNLLRVVGQRMAAWGHVRPHHRIKVAVLGFLSRQDEDLLDACPP